MALISGGLFVLLVQEKRRVAASGIQEREEALAGQEALWRGRAGLSSEEARALVMEEARVAAHRDAAKLEESLNQDVRRRANEALVTFMERHLVRGASSSLSIKVALPSEDTKAKLIGREGRNIRAFEQVTQTDLIIDETPESVHISCFDPIRREAARITLINLIFDGRIHPARIEELHAASLKELSSLLTEECAKEAEQIGLVSIPEPVMVKLGELRLRTSQAQNVWEHSLECAHLALLASQELGLPDPQRSARAALYHDIGKTLGAEYAAPHALAGMEFLREFETDPVVLNAVGAHHLDIEPLYVESHLVILVDGLSAARPGARRESRERHFQRLEELEKKALEFPGVARAYAVQAGRELRVMVEPKEVKDEAMGGLARAIARKLESDVEYSGSLRVVVVRETRAVEVTS